ncbi:uncharacterized protein LY79DRAFT_4507 [Colletotrichum navitas]|uniref:Uncharacterized protein n=1 Tax=Colletotrichum navitas TaxID=681940 RepID=A0AAD8QCH6_9PEZI|nr:uncharacterized protein LY79DRAFT_4507 [Colletotrichum navitas]KAK1600037.1 hypothetical protein LY79DRAFT_4507 [Colletotrichum navitas]
MSMICPRRRACLVPRRRRTLPICKMRRCDVKSPFVKGPRRFLLFLVLDCPRCARSCDRGSCQRLHHASAGRGDRETSIAREHPEVQPSSLGQVVTKPEPTRNEPRRFFKHHPLGMVGISWNSRNSSVPRRSRHFSRSVGAVRQPGQGHGPQTSQSESIRPSSSERVILTAYQSDGAKGRAVFFFSFFFLFFFTKETHTWQCDCDRELVSHPRPTLSLSGRRIPGCVSRRSGWVGNQEVAAAAAACRRPLCRPHKTRMR